jgi:hypothetical protein
VVHTHPVERKRAEEDHVMPLGPVAGADRCGRERGVDRVGGSLVCASTGYRLAGPATAPGAVAVPTVLAAKLGPAAAQDESPYPRNDARGDRRPGARRSRGKPHSGPAAS